MPDCGVRNSKVGATVVKRILGLNYALNSQDLLQMIGVDTHSIPVQPICIVDLHDLRGFLHSFNLLVSFDSASFA